MIVKIPRVLLSHPFELCVSFSVLLMGVQALVRGQAFSGVVTRDLAWFLTMVWQVGIILGAAMVLCALLLRSDPTGGNDARRVMLRGIEQAGLYLTAVSAGVFVVVLVSRGGTSGYAMAMLTGVSVACVLRAIALRRADRATLNAYRDLTGGDH